MAAPRSAAIQIVRPPATAVGPSSPALKERKVDATQRICRNVMIYGSCKFLDQGCAYYHPSASDSLPSAPTTPPLPKKSTLNAGAQAYPTPDSKEATRSGLGAEHVAAPVFVPKTPVPEVLTPAPASPLPTVSAVASEWQPNNYDNGLLSVSGDSGQPMVYEDTSMSYEHSQGADGLYLPQQPFRKPLDHHLYVSPLPHVANPPLTHQPMHAFFIPDDLRRALTARHEAAYFHPGPQPGVPQEVHVYHSLVRLEQPASAAAGVSKVYHWPAPVYRGTSSVDGNVYCLRRIEGFKLVNESAFSVVETWRKLRHPNIVGLREAFTSKAFNDNSLVMVYDFHPDSTTLHEEHLSPEGRRRNALANAAGAAGSGGGLPERVVWSYVVQIANALKAMHSSGLAARNLDPSKILVTGKNRVRINGCGLLDVIMYESAAPLAVAHQEDLVAFGKLVISLCCDFFQPGQHPAAPLEHIKRHYSPDLQALVLFLISKPSAMKTVDEVVRLAGMRVLNELDAMQSYNDVLESALGGELENGRIARLLMKMGFINERPEFDMDPRWAETGDRYVIKLFRDHVFHSVGADGKPVIDLSHVLTLLNKLDAGARSRERVMLMSRDGQSCLVVEFRDIHKCIEAAYGELRNAGLAGTMRH
ncbi:PAB-dependent poly(A)-specific ribonuclease subunit 3 [Cryptotrichosporon argae]